MAKTASIHKVTPEDKLPPVPKAGINKSDGPGSYKAYKLGNYQSPPEVVVADVESAVAGAEPAVVEPGTAADSSNAVPSSMLSRIANSVVTNITPEMVQQAVRRYEQSQDVKVDVQGKSAVVEVIAAGEYLQRTRPNETVSWKSKAPPPPCPPPKPPRGHHSPPRQNWYETWWGNAYWHGYPVGAGTTSILQVNDTCVHAELRSALKEEVGDKQVGDDTPAAKAVRFDDVPTLHYQQVGDFMSLPASSQRPAPPPVPPAAVPYKGADVRRLPPQESVVTEPADQHKWVWGGRVNWWQSNDEWSSRYSTVNEFSVSPIRW